MSIVSEDPRMYKVQKPVLQLNPSDSTYRTLSSSQPESISNQNFNIVLASPLGLGRDLMFNVIGTFTVTTAAGAAGATLLTSAARVPNFIYSLSPHAMNKIISTAKATLNNFTLDFSNVYECSTALPYYSSGGSQQALGFSTDTPCLDYLASYINPTSQSTVFNTDTATRISSDSPAGNSSCITYITYDNNGASSTSATIGFNITFKLPVPLFMQEINSYKDAIFGLNTCNVNLTFTSSPALRMLKIAPTTPQAIIAATLLPTATVAFTKFNMIYSLTTFSDQKIPRELKYNNRSYTLNSTTLSGAFSTGQTYAQIAVGGYQTTTAKVNTYSLNSVPAGILLWAVPYADSLRNSNLFMYQPDQFLPITQLSISFGAKTGILNGATQQQLYQMSVKNGLKVPFKCFAGAYNYDSTALTQALANVVNPAAPMNIYNGCPILVDLRDLSTDVVSGEFSGKLLLDINATVANNIPDIGVTPVVGTQAIPTMQFNTLVIYDQVMTIKDDLVSVSSIYVDKSKILGVTAQTPSTIDGIAGGNWVSDLGNTFANIAGSVLDIAQMRPDHIVDRIKGDRKGVFGSGVVKQETLETRAKQPQKSRFY